MTIIASREVRIEEKRFTLQLCENHRGRCLRIWEEQSGKRSNHVIVPWVGVDNFLDAGEELARFRQ